MLFIKKYAKEMATFPTKTNYSKLQTSFYCSESVYLRPNMLKIYYDVWQHKIEMQYFYLVI